MDKAVVGAHASGANSSTFGVSVLGDFQTAQPPATVSTALRNLIAWKADVHRFDVLGTTVLTVDGVTTTLNNISGHRNVNATDCPGQYLYATLPSLRTATATISPKATRIGGADRYIVAAATSASTFAAGAPIAYIATGGAFPDALAAGPVGGHRGGPVLLTRTDQLVTPTINELKRLKPQRIVILGGPASSPPRSNSSCAATPPASAASVGPTGTSSPPPRPPRRSRPGPHRLHRHRRHLPRRARRRPGRRPPRRTRPPHQDRPARHPDDQRAQAAQAAAHRHPRRPGLRLRRGRTAAAQLRAQRQPHRWRRPVHRRRRHVRLDLRGRRPIAYIATGANFPDALAAGPVGGHRGGPVLSPGPTSSSRRRSMSSSGSSRSASSSSAAPHPSPTRSPSASTTTRSPRPLDPRYQPERPVPLRIGAFACQAPALWHTMEWTHSGGTDGSSDVAWRDDLSVSEGTVGRGSPAPPAGTSWYPRSRASVPSRLAKPPLRAPDPVAAMSISP